MKMNKMAMSDEQMDTVTGGSILPYRVQPGDSLDDIARKYHVTTEQLIAECATTCGVNPAQTKAVIDALVDRIAHYMAIGHGVKVGNLGSFKPVFTSKVAETLEETTLETVRKKKIVFYPGKAFRGVIQDLSISSAGDAIGVKEPAADAGAQQ